MAQVDGGNEVEVGVEKAWLPFRECFVADLWPMFGKTSGPYHRCRLLLAAAFSVCDAGPLRTDRSSCSANHFYPT